MKKIDVKTMAAACGGRVLAGDENAYIERAEIDSRKIKPGDLFVAIKGEVTDGHKYLEMAKEKGAACLLVSDENYEIPEGIAAILADNTVKALQDIAKAYRSSLNIKIIGVTGSVGKTSTSDMIKAICETTYRTQKTKGNFNNHIGLPLTLLSFEPDTEVGILEMGMDKLGEIEFLAKLARPDIGVITNIGNVHIESLGTQDNIFRAKMEITSYFDDDSILVVNGDDKYLKNLESDTYRIIKAGYDAENRFTAGNVKADGEKGISFTLGHSGEAVNVKLPVPGFHNALNGAIAAAACSCLGISIEKASEGLLNMALTDMRLTIREKNGIKVIDDTYNASPASMKSAIDVLTSVEGKRRIAILADMFELGDISETAHREVGSYVAEKKVDLVVAIGEYAKYIAEGASSVEVKYYRTRDEFLKVIFDTIRPGDVVLCKGSRGMAMEIVVNKIMEN